MIPETEHAQCFLSEDELLFHRSVTFHRHRVETLEGGGINLSDRDVGLFVVHLVPQQCVRERLQFDPSQLKSEGTGIAPLGERGSYSRFNVDGFMNYSGHDTIRSYSQIFRDGRLEGVMTGAAYEKEGHRILRANFCEKALFALLPQYLEFCKNVGIAPPIFLFAAFVGCEGVRIPIDIRWGDLSDHAIDRSPAYLPELQIDALDVERNEVLRPLCDSIWQSSGIECSPFFDQEGKWHEAR